MRVAAIYDIHGNVPALETVLAGVDRAGVHATVVGGDLGWAAPPSATVERLRELGPTLFCHGSPRSENERITTATPDPRLHEMLGEVQETLIVCGHTHRQFDRTVGGRRVVNAGSVGLPFEGRVGAFWAALGPTVELRCSDYDLEVARAWFDAHGMPRSFARRLEFSLIGPADPDEVAEYFEGLAAQPGA